MPFNFHKATYDKGELTKDGVIQMHGRAGGGCLISSQHGALQGRIDGG
jgi:hypothetical protein